MIIDNEKKQPFISVAIASYNYGKYLKRGFDAICRQRFTDFEVVYLDDGSTDNSVEIIKEFIEQHPDMSIKLIENDGNKGILYSKTRLFRECSGEYVMLCDADDWMADNCLEKLAACAVESHADRIVSEVCNIGDDGKVIQVQKLPPKPPKWLWNIHHGCLYKRSVVLENNITIEYEPDDVYFITMFNIYCRNTAWIHEPLYYWYVHKDSAGRHTGRDDMALLEKKFEEMLVYIQYAISHNSDDSRETKCFLEILAMKMYYLQLYHSMRYYDVRSKLECYSSLKGIMKKYFPDYIKDKNDKISKLYLRKYAYYIIKYSRIIEKLHLMKPALIAYHLVGKVVYIDQ